MSNERLAEAVKLLRRQVELGVSASVSGDSGRWQAFIDDARAFLRALDTAPADDDAAALVAALESAAQHAHISMHGDKIIYPDWTQESMVLAPPLFTDCPGKLCKHWADALTAARKAPVQE